MLYRSLAEQSEHEKTKKELEDEKKKVGSHYHHIIAYYYYIIIIVVVFVAVPHSGLYNIFRAIVVVVVNVYNVHR